MTGVRGFGRGGVGGGCDDDDGVGVERMRPRCVAQRNSVSPVLGKEKGSCD